MVTLYPGSSSFAYPVQVFEEDADLEYPSEEDLEYPPWFKSFGEITDEAFEQAEFFAQQSPDLKKRAQTPDTIEIITAQVLAHLCSLADGIDRSSFEEAAIAPFDDIDFISSQEDTSTKFSYTQRFHPLYKRESNFYEEYEVEQPNQTQNVLMNIISTIASVIFGVTLSDPPPGIKSTEKIEHDFAVDYVAWEKSIKKHYAAYFQQQMDDAFHQAEELLQFRRDNDKLASFQRYTLVASSVLVGLGKFFNQRSLAIVGLVATAINLIFMAMRYGMNSIKLAEAESELKASVEVAYHEASKHRLNSHLSGIIGSPIP